MLLLDAYKIECLSLVLHVQDVKESVAEVQRAGVTVRSKYIC